ncbi:hypothetical protein V3C99_009340, partial [Haemonchus contortus]
KPNLLMCSWNSQNQARLLEILLLL